MAKLEEAFCYKHMWSAADGDYKSRCPKCAEEKENSIKAENIRWNGLTQEEKIEDLRKQIEGLRKGSVRGFNYLQEIIK